MKLHLHPPCVVLIVCDDSVSYRYTGRSSDLCCLQFYKSPFTVDTRHRFERPPLYGRIGEERESSSEGTTDKRVSNAGKTLLSLTIVAVSLSNRKLPAGNSLFT